MKKSINIRLTDQEFDALYESSQRNLRHPRDQARYILQQALMANSENSKTATSEVSQAQQVNGFVRVP